MCGIVGYVGGNEASSILVDCLEKLEYRGYDSAGVAIHDGHHLKVVKTVGRIALLRNELIGERPAGKLGIAHTRWATHGAPSQLNAHPHTNTAGTIAIVHNGIIENYLHLKKELIADGKTFVSETDSEVVAHLAEKFWTGDLVSTMARIVDRLQGSFALAMVHADYPDSFVVARKDSPLVIGKGNHEMFVASDITALLQYTREMYLMEDREIALVSPDGVRFFNTDCQCLAHKSITVDWNADVAQKDGFAHFMLKEIMEEPKVVRNTIRPRICADKSSVEIEGFTLDDSSLRDINKIFITACGTAYHAGMIAKYLFEHIAKIPVEVEFASEFRYRSPLVDTHTLVIIISQSGETADSLAALREAKRLGAHVLAIVNTVGSSIAREADNVVFTWAGPEIAVASTKAYIAQLSVIHLLVINIASRLGRMERAAAQEYITEFEKIPEKIEDILSRCDQIRTLAERFAHGTDIFFIGRGFDYNIALEGSLKLKEISYIHSEAYAAGELKHGTIALIDKNTFITALATQSMMVEKMISNIKEVKARGATVLAIACQGSTTIEQAADMVFYIPKTPDILVPILTVVPLQLFAYYCAVIRGCDVDKPRNLAKSVTVE